MIDKGGQQGGNKVMSSEKVGQLHRKRSPSNHNCDDPNSRHKELEEIVFEIAVSLNACK